MKISIEHKYHLYKAASCRFELYIIMSQNILYEQLLMNYYKMRPIRGLIEADNDGSSYQGVAILKHVNDSYI